MSCNQPGKNIPAAVRSSLEWRYFQLRTLSGYNLAKYFRQQCGLTGQDEVIRSGFFGVRQTDALRLNHNFALFVEFADGVFEGIFTAMKRCVNGARMQRIKGR